MRRPAIRSTAHKPILSYSILPILSYARATTTTHNPRKVNWHHIRSTTFVNLRPAQDSFQHHIESGAGIGNNRSIYQYFKLLQIKQINIFFLEKLIKMIVWLFIYHNYFMLIAMNIGPFSNISNIYLSVKWQCSYTEMLLKNDYTTIIPYHIL